MFWKNKKNEQSLLKKDGEIAKLVFAFFLGGFMVILYFTNMGTNILIPKSSYKEYQELEKMVNTIEQKYYEEVDRNSLYESMKIGLFGLLEDGYSYYLGEQGYQRYVDSGEGLFFGYGLSGIKYEKTHILVSAIMQHSPAEKEGMKSGDKIVELNGKTIEQLGVEKAEMILLDNENTNIKVGVEREGETEKLYFNLTKEEIEEESIDFEMIDEIGYIQISQFIKDTGIDFDSAVDYLLGQGAKAFVIDLRNNGGGLFNSAIEVADRILPKSTITYTKTREGKEKYFEATDEESITLPIIVLVNENSASASELVTAALKDNEKAKVYGVTTFGKGIVQEAYKLKNDSGFKLTTKQYFSPKSTKIHKIGVKPDIIIPQDKNIKANSKEDVQLKTALEDLKKLDKK